MAIDKKYLDEASGVYDGQYETKRKALENALNTNITNLNSSKAGINQNYDDRVGNQNLQNNLGKNNFSNTMLGRGMGRSTIASSGLAGMDNGNARVVEGINKQRAGDLNNVDNNIVDLKNGYNNNLLGLDAEKMGAINTLAMSLRDKAVEEDWKQKQFDFQKQQNDADQAYKNAQFEFQKQQAEQEQAYKNAQLALQRESLYARGSGSSGSSGSSTSKKESPNDLYATYMNYRDRGHGRNFLVENRTDIISRYGMDTYQELASLQDEYVNEKTANWQPVEQPKQQANGFLKNFFQWAIPGGKKWGEK